MSTAMTFSAPDHPVVSRFSIAILSLLLLSMALGSRLPDELVDLTFFTGMVGVIAYLTSSYLEHRRWQRNAEVTGERLVQVAGRRMSRFYFGLRRRRGKGSKFDIDVINEPSPANVPTTG